MKLSRAKRKRLAKDQIDDLLQQALRTAPTNLERAQKFAGKARRLAMKFNIRLPYEKRQLFCRGCKRLIVPGINARIRLRSRPRGVRITCNDCGHVYRKLLDPPRY